MIWNNLCQDKEKMFGVFRKPLEIFLGSEYSTMFLLNLKDLSNETLPSFINDCALCL